MIEGKWAFPLGGWWLYDLVQVDDHFTLTAKPVLDEGDERAVKIRLTCRHLAKVASFKRQLAKHGIILTGSGQKAQARLDKMLGDWFSPKQPGYKPPPVDYGNSPSRHLRAASKWRVE